MMRAMIFVLLTSVVAVGCGREPAAAEGAGLPNEPIAEIATVDPGACGSGSGFDALPEGVCLSESYRFRGDRSYLDAAGRERHRLTFDYVDGDAEQVASNVSRAFAISGYYVRPRMDTPDGSVQIPLTKKDLGTTYLSVQSLPATAPADPNRKGSFFIDFLGSPVSVAAGRSD